MAKTCKVNLVHVSDPEIYGNPLSLGYLKAYADSIFGKKVDIRIVESPKRWTGRQIEKVCAGILQGKPDIVGFSCYLWNVLAVIELCKELKRRSPKTRIVLGGPDASTRGASILADTGADALVMGEGELTFAELILKTIVKKPWAGTAGTITPSKGGAVEGPQRPPIANLDIIPSPYLTGIFDGKPYKFLVHETSRGCPFNCSFCVWTSKGKIRRFSMERSAREIDWIIRNSGKGGSRLAGDSTMHVFLADQDLTMDEARAEEMLGLIRRGANGRNLVWIIECDLKFWTPRIAKAGNFTGVSFCFGIQSTDGKIVQATGRTPLTLEQMKQKLYVVKEQSPKAHFLLQLMLGLPGDSLKGFIESMRWCLDVCADLQTTPVVTGSPEHLRRFSPDFQRYFTSGVQIFPVSVFPGTQLEKEAEKLGVEWDRKPPYYVKATREFPAKDMENCLALIKALEDFTARLYSRPVVQMTLDNG
ncbi:MAG: radical SAM protein [Elusimicrobia bacterium]|nr:radical SAM protein [Elusimicrobiota bacterium]